MKKASNKTHLFLGLLFIFSAFMCIAGVFYQVIHGYQQSSREVEEIRKDLAESEAKKREAQRQAQDLANRMGRGIEFERLMAAAEQRYGPTERSRREGDLWIDLDGKEWMVTLGAINGLKGGSRLRVMDGDKQIGLVVVKTVLDVVSYVEPLENRGQFAEEMYRVVLEE